MTDEARIDPMDEPKEVTELEDDEMDEVAGGLTLADGGGALSTAFPDVCKTPQPTTLDPTRIGTTDTSKTDLKTATILGRTLL